MSVDRGAPALELCGDQGLGISMRIVIDNVRPSEESRARPREDSELCSSVSITQTREELYSDLSQHTGENNLVQNYVREMSHVTFHAMKEQFNRYLIE